MAGITRCRTSAQILFERSVKTTVYSLSLTADTGLRLSVSVPDPGMFVFRHLRLRRFCVFHRFMSSDVKNRTKVLSKSTSIPVSKLKGPKNDVDRIRNIGIIAHIDAGKTTTTERMLFYSGLTRHLGDVDDGDTVMDYMEQERNRGITITSAAITFLWNKHKVNLIDTPGHVDFTLEVERALRVLDGAVTIIDASAGVEAQTLTVWRQADNYGIPCVIFINKMDKKNADFQSSVQSLREKLKVEPLLLQIPIGEQTSFSGVVDLITMDKLLWKSSSREGKVYKRISLDPEEDAGLLETAADARVALIEDLANIDEEVAALVLDDVNYDDVPVDVLRMAVRRACLQRRVVPVLCGSSLKNKGVQPLLDAIVSYLPCPSDIKHNFVEFYNNDLCALAFKIVHDKQRGPLTFLRLYSGQLASTDTLYNVNQSCTEKMGRLMELYADEYKDIQEANTGNIVAVSGLKQTVSGDTIASSSKSVSHARKAYEKSVNLHFKQDSNPDPDLSDTERSMEPLLASLRIPEPVFLCAIEPGSMSQQAAMEHALSCLTREDPSLRVAVNEDTGQTVLSGMGELHLEIILDRIRKEYGVDADIGHVYIAYQETIQERVTQTHVLDKVLGETRHVVTVEMSVGPVQDAQDHSKKVPLYVQPKPGSSLKERPLRPWHMKAVRSGIASAVSRGPILSFPVVDVEVTLHDLEIGRKTSIPMVTACVAEAVGLILARAQPVLMEPVMSLEIQTTEPYVGTVLKDISQRRSQIHDVQVKSDARVVLATTPLSELMGYATALRTFTSGTASFSMELAHYRSMSEPQQNAAVAKATGFLST